MKKSLKKDAIAITSTHSNKKILLIYMTNKMYKNKQSSAFKQLLETLFLTINLCTGFITDVICTNTKVCCAVALANQLRAAAEVFYPDLSALLIHDTQSAQILQKQDGRNIYAIMKTVCPPAPGYDQNGGDLVICIHIYIYNIQE